MPTRLNEYLQILSQLIFIKIGEALENFQKPAKDRNLQQSLHEEQINKLLKGENITSKLFLFVKHYWS